MITYRYIWENNDQQYGNDTIVRETEPFLQNTIPVKFTNQFQVIPIIKKCLRNDSPHSLHHFTHPNMGFMGFVPTQGKKIISINDAIAPKYYPPHWTERLLYAGYQKFDAVLTISEASKITISERLHIPKNRIYVAPLGVNTTKFCPIETDLREHYKIPKDAFLFGTAGNTRKHKNILLPLSVLSELRKIGVNAYFIRTGYYNREDPFQVSGMKDIETLKNPYFINLPYQDDLLMFYNSLDCYIAPSIEEGFDLPVLEALACGVPIIASRIPAHEELLENKFPMFDLVSWPHSIALLIRATHRAYTEDICRHFAEQFSWEKTAKKIQEAYDAVCES